jgi:membrane-associated phospholipid phosphatase
MQSSSRRNLLYLKWTLILSVMGLLYLIYSVKTLGSGRSEAMDSLLLQQSHLHSQTASGEGIIAAAKFLSLIGNWQFIAPIGGLLLLLSGIKRLPWRDFVLYLAAVAGTSGLTLAFKYIVNRPRQEIVPALEKAPFASFPSGHTVFTLVIYGYLAHLILSRMHSPPRWLAWVLYGGAVLLTVLVGCARVYLGTHYPTDVVAGILIGMPWLLAVIALANHYEKRRSVTNGTVLKNS